MLTQKLLTNLVTLKVPWRTVLIISFWPSGSPQLVRICSAKIMSGILRLLSRPWRADHLRRMKALARQTGDSKCRPHGYQLRTTHELLVLFEASSCRWRFSATPLLLFPKTDHSTPPWEQVENLGSQSRHQTQPSFFTSSVIAFPRAIRVWNQLVGIPIKARDPKLAPVLPSSIMVLCEWTIRLPSKRLQQRWHGANWRSQGKSKTAPLPVWNWQRQITRLLQRTGCARAVSWWRSMPNHQACKHERYRMECPFSQYLRMICIYSCNWLKFDKKMKKLSGHGLSQNLKSSASRLHYI